YSGPDLTPANNPYITVVGGTDLTMSSGGAAWIGETTWPGSGGGVSTTYAIPSWQQGISMSANHGSATKRNLPDVSMVGDSVFLIADKGQTYAVAGTSISAPLWAGFTALINQLALANGEPLVGFINPALYEFAKGSGVTSGFHDITTGNNKNSSSPNNFSAVGGYDLCTGWGTPKVSLLTELALPEPLRNNGGASIISGAVGGPFIPPNQTFSLTNHAAGSLD